MTRGSPRQRRKVENRSRSITTITIITTTITTAITALSRGVTIIITIITTTTTIITAASGFTFVSVAIQHPALRGSGTAASRRSARTASAFAGPALVSGGDLGARNHIHTRPPLKSVPSYKCRKTAQRPRLSTRDEARRIGVSIAKLPKR